MAMSLQKGHAETKHLNHGSGVKLVIAGFWILTAMSTSHPGVISFVSFPTVMGKSQDSAQSTKLIKHLLQCIVTQR
jgi:hypothetical protein